MLSTSQSEQATDEGVILDAKPACVALVPVVPSAQWSQNPSLQWSLPSSIFVTHLIATAEPVPQTRGLRQATLVHARTAYSASQHPIQSAGRRTRQII